MLLLFTLVSSGLMAGVYFVFSSFMMKSLALLPDHTAVVCMNCINRVILKSLFMPIFFASTLSSLMLVFLTNDLYVRIAGLIYFFGMFACTAVKNVPLNNALRDAPKEQLAAMWTTYLTVWTRWNHIRTISCLFCFMLLLYRISTPI